MCVSHHIKFFETFPVKPRPQAWKLQVKPLYHRSPKNSSQVLERAGKRPDSSSFWIQAGSLDLEDAQSMTWDKSCQVGDVCPPCGGPLQGGQRWLRAPSRQAAEKCCIASFQNATIIVCESVPSWSPRIRASLLDTQPVRLYRALCSGGPALAYCSVAAILKFMIGWLLVMFCFVFNKGPACNGHHLILGFTNYEAGPVWDLCPSLMLDEDWPVETGVSGTWDALLQGLRLDKCLLEWENTKAGYHTCSLHTTRLEGWAKHLSQPSGLSPELWCQSTSGTNSSPLSMQTRKRPCLSSNTPPASGIPVKPRLNSLSGLWSNF